MSSTWFATLVVLLLLSGCATQQVTVQARFPAAYPAAAKLKTITVYNFQGQDGAAFANQLTSELKTAALDGNLAFTVVSPDLIGSKFRHGTVVGSHNMASVLRDNRRQGVDGIYYGVTSPVNFTSRNWTEQRTKCLEYEGFLKCKKNRQQTISVRCYEEAATYQVQPTLLDTRTGSVVYTESVSSITKNRYCDDAGRQGDRTEMTAALRADVARKIRRKVAPYNDTLKVQLKEDTGDVPQDAVGRFQGGLEFSKAGQLDRACAIWQELSAIVPGSNKSISLLFNLGVCAEIVSDYDRAIELYSKADSLLKAPDSMVSEARKRALDLKNNEKSITRSKL